jgi:enamine deaminase RidA (YjgF/YER057c/UK114 family)
MTALLHDVEGRPSSPFYSQVSVASGTRLIHLAGQVGSDAEGAIVDGGLAAQADRAMLNVGLALEAAGASEGDLVKLTVHVVIWAPEKLAELGAGLMAAAEARPRPRVPITLLGAATLYEPGMLVEIEAIAVAD